MRLFVAICFPEEIKAYLSECSQRLRFLAASGRFTQWENFHLTLAFLGEIPPDRLASLKTVLSSIVMPRFSLLITGLGKFQQPHGALYWAGVSPSLELSLLFQQLNGRLRTLGFSVGKNDHCPHITLGRAIRLKKDARLYPLSVVPPKRFEVRKISLMRSDRIEGLLTYTEIDRKFLK